MRRYLTYHASTGKKSENAKVCDLKRETYSSLRPVRVSTAFPALTQAPVVSPHAALGQQLQHIQNVLFKTTEFRHFLGQVAAQLEKDFSPKTDDAVSLSTFYCT